MNDYAFYFFLAHKGHYEDFYELTLFYKLIDFILHILHSLQHIDVVVASYV